MSRVSGRDAPEAGFHFDRVPQLYRLTSLRFFAAGAVFLYHLSKDTEWLPKEWFFRYGFSGVGFFFILSGFVLAWSYRRPVKAGEFYIRRFARVYPSHFAMAFVALLLPVLAAPVTIAGIFANLGLMQAWFLDWSIVFSLNAVSWSLSCEGFFYLLTPWLIRWFRRASSRTISTICGGWFGVCSLASAWFGMSGNVLDVWAYTNPLLRSGEFVAGIALALLVGRGWSPRVPFSASIALLFAAVGIISLAPGLLPQTVTDVFLAPFFAVVILSAAMADITKKKGLMGSRPLVYAGEVSFAFYLVHELVIFNLAHLFELVSMGMPNLARGLIAAMLSILVAVLLHHAVERPGQKVIVELWKKRHWLSTLGRIGVGRKNYTDARH